MFRRERSCSKGWITSVLICSPPRCLAELVDGVLVQRHRVPVIRVENPRCLLGFFLKKNNIFISPFFLPQSQSDIRGKRSVGFWPPMWQDFRCYIQALIPLLTLGLEEDYSFTHGGNYLHICMFIISWKQETVCRHLVHLRSAFSQRPLLEQRGTHIRPNSVDLRSVLFNFLTVAIKQKLLQGHWPQRPY